jgi:hypothetical protein
MLQGFPQILGVHILASSALQAVSEVSEIVSAAALELKAAPDQHLLPSNMASPFLLANLASCLQASGLSSCVRSASQQSTQRPLSTSVLSVVNHSHIIVRHPACPGTPPYLALCK